MNSQFALTLIIILTILAFTQAVDNQRRKETTLSTWQEEIATLKPWDGHREDSCDEEEDIGEGAKDSVECGQISHDQDEIKIEPWGFFEEDAEGGCSFVDRQSEEGSDDGECSSVDGHSKEGSDDGECSSVDGHSEEGSDDGECSSVDGHSVESSDDGDSTYSTDSSMTW
jgi:hypothetical protein